MAFRLIMQAIDREDLENWAKQVAEQMADEYKV